MVNEPSFTFKTGEVVVDSSAATPLATDMTTLPIPVKGIQLKARKANSGIIYLGLSDVDADDYGLDPGESVFLPIKNIADLFFLAGSDNDEICFIIY